MKESDSDLEAIRGVLGGDPDAFEPIVRKYQDRILQLCRSMAGPAQAEDAAQEVFLNAYQALSGFEGRSSLSTWLHRIAVNHCLNVIAKRKQERSESLEERVERAGDQALPSQPSFSGALEAREQARTLLDRLKPEERAILTLRELQGFSYQEIAEALDLSLEAVKVRIHRARRALAALAKDFL